MDQHIIALAQQYYEQSQQTEEQLLALREQLHQLAQFRESLEGFQHADKKEIFASFGRGIFFPAEIKSKDVLVDVGAGIFVKKTLSEAQTLVDKQIAKLHELRQTLQHLSETLSVKLEEIARSMESFKSA